MLTVAHLNHQPADCRDENLKAMCQRCHLRYDRDLHVMNSARTRRSKKNNGELFSLEDYTPIIKAASFTYYVPS